MQGNDWTGGYDGPPETERPDFPDREIVYECDIIRIVHGGKVHVVVHRSKEPWLTFTCDDIAEAKWITERLSGQRTISTDSEND